MEKNKKIRKFIIHYYKKNKRKLPWREIQGKLQNPYYTLIAEIMLQQTRVDTVRNYYKNFLLKWPTINSLSSANQSDILTYWSGLGYYRRAINLHNTAKLIVKEHNSIIPNDYLTLIKMPGIGDYTAAAILGFAYGKYSIIIDTNIRKFLSRIYGLKSEQLSNKKIIFSLASGLFPKIKSGDFAQAIMDYSSDICKSKKPKCKVCKINSYCNYKNIDEKNELKIKVPKQKMYCVSHFYLYKNTYFLLRKKPLNLILGGMYEVPGSVWCKSKISNDNYAFNFNDLKKYDKIPLEKIIRHDFTHITLYSNVIIIKVISKKFKISEPGTQDIKWFKLGDLKSYPIPSLTKKIIDYSFSALSDLK